MGLLLDLVTLPVLGSPRLVLWLATNVSEEAMRQYLDKGSIRGALLELQQRYDAGELDEEEYDKQERALLERLSAIREATEQQS